MSTEKKPVVEKKKTNDKLKLEKNKQERLKTLSKIIYILARIGKILSIIAIVGLLLCVILTPVVVKNIKFEDQTVTMFGNELKYETNGNQVDLYIDNVIVGSMTSDEKVSFDMIISKLEDTDMTKSFAFIELALIAGSAIMFIFYFILRYVDMLFVNISEKDTPFTEENSDYINKIAYLSLVTVLISFVTDIVSSLFFKDSMVSFNLSRVIYVLILYIIAYIFEYACILQKESKKNIYE
jgi:hypothetical protein